MTKSMQALSAALLIGAAHLATNVALAGGGVYPEPALPYADSSKTRAQVKAELMETIRLGLLPLGDGDVPAPTAEQQRQIVEAGERAAAKQQVAKGERK